MEAHCFQNIDVTKMNQETANYIVTYYAFLYNESEKLAIEHEIVMMSLQTPEDIENYKRLYPEGHLSDDDDVLELVGLSIDAFNYKVAERMLYEHEDKIYLNSCEKCHSLARTPLAKQCRHCGYDWH
ncbi:hypothetical protein ACXZ1K_15900 [Pedobacter sp. PWIIR3]